MDEAYDPNPAAPTRIRRRPRVGHNAGLFALIIRLFVAGPLWFKLYRSPPGFFSAIVVTAVPRWFYQSSNVCFRTKFPERCRYNVG